MGDIAESMINGDFDFFTGEYIGKGYGMPRTKNNSLEWEQVRKRQKEARSAGSVEAAYNGVKKYIAKKWSGRKDTPNIRALVYEYTGKSDTDIKQLSVEIQKDWNKFCRWVNEKMKCTRY